MAHLAFPLRPGSQGLEVSEFQKSLQYLITNKYILPELQSIDGLSEEIEKKFFGEQTNLYAQSAYSFLQLVYNDEVTNEYYIALEDKKLLDISNLNFKLNGIIFNQFGKPIPNATLKLYKIFLKDRTEKNEQTSDANGTYSIDLVRSSIFENDEINVDIQFDITIDGDSNVYRTDVFYNIVESQELNITLTIDVAPDIKSEYEIISEKISATFDGQNIDEDDAAFISAKIGETESKVLNILLAKKFGTKTGLQPELFYAILNKSKPQSFESIANISLDEVVNYINLAIATNIISHSFVDSGIDFYNQLALASANAIISNNTTPEEKKSKEILSNVFSNTQLPQFLEYYFTNNTDSDVLNFERISQELTFVNQNKFDELREVLNLSNIAGGNPPILKKLILEDNVNLVNRSVQDWESDIADALQNHSDTFVFPSYVTGVDEIEKKANYAEILKSNVDNAFPGLTMQVQISSDNTFPLNVLKDSLSNFSQNNPNFDLLKTSVLDLEQEGEFDFAGVDQNSFIQEFTSIQRVNAVTGDLSLSKTLLSTEYTSASAIALADRATLRSDLTALSLSDVTIDRLIDNSSLQYYLGVATAVSLWGEYVTPSAIFSKPADANPEWRTLFPNTLDMCCCEHCNSVFSPAAYMVDCLEILRRQNSSAYNWLKNKRPDAWQVELSCKNTNTPLPYIDLVTEILEEMVLASFSGTSNMPSIRAYNTTWDEKTLNAIPQYVNTVGTNNPYSILKSAVYPWTGPYNYYYDQIKEHLGILDIKPIHIAQALSTKEKPNLLDNIGDACIFLDITQEFKTIVLDNSTTNLFSYYGFRLDGSNHYIIDPKDRTQKLTVSGSNLLPTSSYLMNRVDIFLQQSGECYNCLIEILDCYYINPVLSGTFGSYVRKLKIENITGTRSDGKAIPTDTCILSELKISGIQADDLKRIHIFMKMQKKLGWTKYQVDKVFRTIGVSQNGLSELDLIKIAQMKYVSELLGREIDEILVFWRPIEDMVYSDYKGSQSDLLPSEYENYFRNNKVISDFGSLTNYPFPARLANMATNLLFNDPTNPNNPNILNNLNYFLAATNITQVDYQTYNKKFGNNNYVEINDDSIPKFNINNISFYLREDILARSLNITAQEWIFFRDSFLTYTGSPFTVDSTGGYLKLIEFIYHVNQLRNLNLEIEDYKNLFFDEYFSDVDLEARKDELTQQVNTLKNVLNKSSESVIKNDKIDEDAFKKKYIQIFDDKTIDFLISKIGKISNAANPSSLSATDISTSDKNAFIALIPQNLTDTEKDLIKNRLVNATAFLTVEKDRFVEIDRVFTSLILNATISKYFETTFKLPSNLVSDYLNYDFYKDPAIGVVTLKYNSYDIYNDTGFIKAADYSKLTLINNGNPHKTRFLYQRIDSISKLASLFHKFKLSYKDVNYLIQLKELIGISSVDFFQLPTGAAFHSDLVGQVSKNDWINLLKWLYVRNRLSDSTMSIFEIIYNTSLQTTGNSKKTLWFDSFYGSLGISADSLQALVGLKTSNASANKGVLNFDFNAANPQNIPDNYIRILTALDLADSVEVKIENLVNMLAAINAPSNQNTANQVVQVVKAKFSNEEWLTQVKPVNDRMRIARRDALVNYLLQAPPKAYNHWSSSNDIYETLFIDTQMMPIVKTSRIKQYISSIQIFYDRCILQIERQNGVPIILQAEDIRQWNLWRKYYRIWEANRKVFIYPENWIEPELRDDKSPFFKELEKYLKQNDITEDNMRDAYETYLDKVEEISNLEIVAVYSEEPNADAFNDIIHVWGRTHSHPHVFYYRKRVQNEWSAWEKMNIEIDGEHFVAIKHRGRLKFFWLTFEIKTVDKPSKLKADSESIVEKYIQIGLRWTQLVNNVWQPTKVGKEFVNHIDTGVFRTTPFSDTNYGYNYAKPRPGWVTNTSVSTLETVDLNLKWFQEFLNPYATINGQDGELFIHLTSKKFWLNHGRVQTYLENKIGNIRTLNDDEIIEATIACLNSNPQQWYSFVGTFVMDGNKLKAYEDQWTTWDLYDYIYTSYYEHFLKNNNFKPNKYKYELNDNNSDFYHRTQGVNNNRDRIFKSIPYSEASFVLPRYTKNNKYNKLVYSDSENSFFVERNTSDYTYKSLRLKKINEIRKEFNARGIDGILSKSFIANLATSDNMDFYNSYQPVTSQTNSSKYANSLVSFDFSDPNAIYNWELFFHIPMLIANKLMKDQKFFEAMKWYHYVFNPYNRTGAAPSNPPYPNVERFWHFYPFYEEAKAGVPTIETIMNDKVNLPEQVKRWAMNPFKPHLVARTRRSAYMKNVVMKYIDNLVAWGDMLFRRDTMESINEAILLYVLAAQLLGRKPNGCIPARASTGNRKYQDFVDNPTNINAFSNALQRIESILAPTGMSKIVNSPFYQIVQISTLPTSPILGGSVFSSINSGSQISNNLSVSLINQNSGVFSASARPVEFPVSYSSVYNGNLSLVNETLPVSYVNDPNVNLLPIGYQYSNPNAVMMYYFCIPQNEKLLSYWDLVADRLFKIRNSQNIEGVERQLALFEPPIDPAMLVKAAASGMSLTDAISDLYAPMPLYRFQIMVQKASELAQEVKSLGQSLLSALEKKDAESIAMLRSTKEIELLEMVKELRSIQIKEAQYQLASLQQQEKMISLRKDYYNGLISGGLNENESTQLDNMKLTIPFKIGGQAMHMLGGFLNLVPDIKAGGPFTLGAMFGGRNLGHSAQAAGDVLNMVATILDIEASMAGIKAGHSRREQDWKQQLKTANIELKQIEKQILASQIRVEMAKLELANHNKQIDNAKSIDEAMHDKYTNEDLYDWMIGEISSTYFQSYKLAFDVARKAERCYHFELATEPATSPSFIQFGYWDSLKKGLLSGESLLFDIKRMDVSYLDSNKRLQEMTKHISLAQINPAALLKFKKDKVVSFELPEWLFDMDHPGQYLRRIKSVSISIPCVAGPYTTVAAKLTLNTNKIRKTPLLGSSYAENTGGGETRFSTYFMGGQSIATSSAQNDSGMFELNFKDERYLPFEGAGVISEWTLEIPSQYAQFDINSISDVIMHINYTAKYDGGLKTAANANLTSLLATDNSPLPRIFNLKQEFANEWNAYLTDVANNVTNPTLKITLDHSYFPSFCKGKDLTMNFGLVGYQLKDNESLSNPNLELHDTVLLNDPATVNAEGKLTELTSKNFKTNKKINQNQSQEFKFTLKIGSSPTQITVADLDSIRDLYFVLIYKK